MCQACSVMGDVGVASVGSIVGEAKMSADAKHALTPLSFRALADAESLWDALSIQEEQVGDYMQMSMSLLVVDLGRRTYLRSSLSWGLRRDGHHLSSGWSVRSVHFQDRRPLERALLRQTITG